MSMDMSHDTVQRMMLTPKMHLSMHVLQLNIMELRLFIRGELVENPLLEEEFEIMDREQNNTINEDISMLSDAQEKEEYLSFPGQERFDAAGEEKKRYLESLVVKDESLYEHLYWQLQVLARDDEEKRIGRFIIGNLDENGFVAMDLKEMREKMDTDIRTFKRTLTLIRGFDPIGVAAKDIKESLLLQLILSGKGNSHLYKIVYLHWDDLKKGYFKKISKALSISLKEVKKGKKRLSFFNPKPGTIFSAEKNAYFIESDVFFNKNNGMYDVEVNQEALPKLSVNKFYQSILNNKMASIKTKEYIHHKLLGARWLIDAIKSRKKTITRVCEYLGQKQKNFLRKGAEAIEPLTLKETAIALSVSEATVSRVVANKYAQVFNRVFSLKEFFARGLQTMDRGIVSNTSIKSKIVVLIAGEDKERPLSDSDIFSALLKEGVKVSRRTVTKYRQRLRIPSFRYRRQ